MITLFAEANTTMQLDADSMRIELYAHMRNMRMFYKEATSFMEDILADKRDMILYRESIGDFLGSVIKKIAEIFGKMIKWVLGVDRKSVV